VWSKDTTKKEENRKPRRRKKQNARSEGTCLSRVIAGSHSGPRLVRSVYKKTFV
jgi:hypothetical protein